MGRKNRGGDCHDRTDMVQLSRKLCSRPAAGKPDTGGVKRDERTETATDQAQKPRRIAGMAWQIVDDAQWGTAAFNGGDFPYCVALNFARSGQTLYFHCARQGHKIDCLRADSRVCVSFVAQAQIAEGKYTTYYRSATLFGVAEPVTDRQERLRALELLCRKYGSYNENFDEEVQKWGDATQVWRIETAYLTGKVNLPKA